MALIKNSQSTRLVKEAIVLDMGDLGLHAQRIIQAARDQAAEIVAEANVAAQRLIDDASEKGRTAGFARGVEQGQQTGREEGRQQAHEEFRDRLKSLSESWTDALSKWERQRETLLHDASEDVIRFAVQVAGKVVHRVIANDFTVVKDQIHAALQLLGKSTATEVVINPADRALIEEVLPELVQSMASCQHIAIREDESMLRGGCIVKSKGGHVDASIETQLERIAATFCGEETNQSAASNA